jgi:NADPH2:quinone reductase
VPEPGECLVVQGASGNIGDGALQIGKLLGARTIAAASSERGATRARELGADHVVDHKAEDVTTRALEITDGCDPDVMFDPLTGERWTMAADEGWAGVASPRPAREP